MNHARGFTLIELMLVIVIIGVFASLVGLSMGGSEQRQQLLARERLADDLSLVRLEADERMAVLGVQWQPARQDQPAGYQVVRFEPQAQEESERWAADPAFAFRPLPEGVTAQVSALTLQNSMSAGNSPVMLGQAPTLLWLGNGEANPARIQLMTGQKPLGEALYVAENGRVSDREDGAPEDEDSDRGRS